MTHIVGHDRSQTLLLPESLDDYVGPENPYGYLNRIRSSRRLEAETHRNIEVIWLLRHLKPDFKTLADFRRDNRKAFRPVFRQFVLLCRQLDLFGRELLAVDGKPPGNPPLHGAAADRGGVESVTEGSISCISCHSRTGRGRCARSRAEGL
jgi:hypothetical protein